MKKIFFILVIECFSLTSFSQTKYTIDGKESAWQNIEIISANTSFEIFGDGIVDFGCNWGSCKDDITAGVEGSSWWSWWQKRGYTGLITTAIFYDSYSSWVTFLKNVYSSGDDRCNYDQGGLWVAITNSSSVPSTSNIVSVDLYYWYDKLFKQTGPIKYNQKIWIWVCPHDGGMDPYTCSIEDYSDNIGNYRVWVKIY